MSAHAPLGSRLTRAIRDTCKALGIDARMGLQRYCCEQILTGFQRVQPVPFAVGGGLIHHQIKRETGDADIRFVRRLDEEEIHRAFHDMTGLLEERGIRIKKVSDAIELKMHAGNKGMRFKVCCDMEGTRVDVHIDIGFRANSYGLPEVHELDKSTPEFFRMQRDLGFGFRGWVFKKETQVAEKFCTALQLGRDTTRLKDFWDIAFMSEQGIDRDFVIKELTRVIFERRLEHEVQDILPNVPKAMDLDFIDGNQEAWETFVERYRRMQWTNFDQVMDRVRFMYGDIRKDVLRSVAVKLAELAEAAKPVTQKQARMRRGADLVATLNRSLAERIAKRRKERGLPDGVIDLDDVRDRRAAGLR